MQARDMVQEPSIMVDHFMAVHDKLSFGWQVIFNGQLLLRWLNIK
jgi:hypothetical protein